jgi:hypothetical protein
MSEDINKLRQMLERATAVEDASVGELDQETVALREAWLSFGQLLEAAGPRDGAAVELPQQLAYELSQYKDIAFAKAVPRRARPYSWSLSVGVLVAASLLMGFFLTTWAPRGVDEPRNASPDGMQTAAIKADDRALVQQKQPATVADELRWDDTLDEQIDQVGQQVLYAEQRPGDAVAMLEYNIEQMQQELDENRL